MWLTDLVFGLKKAPLLSPESFTLPEMESPQEYIGEISFRLGVDGNIESSDSWRNTTDETALHYAQFLHAIHSVALVHKHASTLLQIAKFGSDGEFISKVLKNWYNFLEEEENQPMVKPSQVPVTGIQQ